MLHASLSTDPTNTNVQMDAQTPEQTHIGAHRRHGSGILIFRCANAHVDHGEDLHFCTISRKDSRAAYRTRVTLREASPPTRCAFKSGPLPFIDSNLRIVLEF